MVGWNLAESQPDLAAPERSIVMSAIRHYEAERYLVHAFAVMNDHIHLLIKPLGDHQLKTIVHSIKSFSAHRMRRDFQRQAPIWLREYWDRIVRNEVELKQTIDYILQNPSKRWPGMLRYSWCGVGKTAKG